MLTAIRFVREFRGTTRPSLIEADDGCLYVVKLRTNPQHPRVLVNEWIGCRMLRHLGIATPHTTALHIPAALAANIPFAAAGWHFASQYPANISSFDVLPDSVLTRVGNLDHFLGVLVADKWMANTDMRQCIFVRDRMKNYLAEGEQRHSLRKSFVAVMIDQDRFFDGYRWRYEDAPGHGLYFRPAVYSNVVSMDDFETWIERATAFSEADVTALLRTIPNEWIDDHQALCDLVYSLVTHRSRRLPDLILNCCVACRRYLCDSRACEDGTGKRGKRGDAR